MDWAGIEFEFLYEMTNLDLYRTHITSRISARNPRSTGIEIKFATNATPVHLSQMLHANHCRSYTAK